jgi:hypothetical protein
MNEGVKFQKIQPRQVGIAQPAGHQRRVQDQQRRISRRDNRLTLAHGIGDAAPQSQPATAVIGMKGGQFQRGQGGGVIHWLD